MPQKRTKISVRNLVEFVMQHGDIDARFRKGPSALDGIKGHKKVQKSRGEEYQAEVGVKFLVCRENIEIEVKGRIDGLFEETDITVIEEIKTTTRSLDELTENYNFLHMAQGKCYAYIYAENNDLSEIVVQLTYYNIETKEVRSIRKEFEKGELESFFNDLIDKYLYWAIKITNWQYDRNSSIVDLNFPFTEFRKGQREFAAAVYRTARDGKKLFARAPTGIGKTIASLFPAFKAMGEKHTSKIFYLTAKTMTRTVAEKAYCLMAENGLKLKSITLTAKDKICFKDEAKCNPDYCEFARGYYDRVKDALSDAYTHDFFDRDTIEEIARKYKICPFEFSLDLSLWCDLIICDYNYVFDPRVYLRRFFTEKNDFTFLVDEAHNLPDRARSMFSAELFKKSFLELKKSTKTGFVQISKISGKINSLFLTLSKLCLEESTYTNSDYPPELFNLFHRFVNIAEPWLAENSSAPFLEELLQLYFEVKNFIKISDFFDSHYIFLADKRVGKNNLKVKLYCIDPSALMEQVLERCRSVVFFSATLTPMDYFIKILGGDQKTLQLSLSSPFPRENLCLLGNYKISTKYRERESSYLPIAVSIAELVKYRKGNYLVFFSSYKYMEEVFIRLQELGLDIDIICQKSGMSEEERVLFLDKFRHDNKKSLVGFAVMGGIFGEGIDLTGERLSGAIIVGTGLSMVCLENDLIKKYYDAEKGNGFDFAYTYPGMNKVLQAAGRVIRTEKDRGVVFLIDERFAKFKYRKLFPPEWVEIANLSDPKETGRIVSDFWNDSR